MSKYINNIPDNYISPKNAGNFYKDVGTVVSESPIKRIEGLGGNDPMHMVERMSQRNMSIEDVTDIINNPTVVSSQWQGKRFAYISEKGAVIVERIDGTDIAELVTCWSRSDFNDGGTFEQALKEALN